MSDQEAAIRAACTALAEALIAASRDGRPVGPEQLLSVDDAAVRMGCGRTRLYHELDAGTVRSVKVGRRRLIPESSIADFVAAQSPQK